MAASEHKLVVFKGKSIRRTLHQNEWWFVVADVVEALTDTPNASDYIKKMRSRDEELAKGWGQIVTPLSVETTVAGWFQRKTTFLKNRRGSSLAAPGRN
ncbi:MAG: hypothetical protein HYU99_04645 [Deltaproteobacteria bacterium]|nr:hypothetical protein [Deltaproteobacteria bacterium]